jgi:hypothetical protein
MFLHRHVTKETILAFLISYHFVTATQYFFSRVIYSLCKYSFQQPMNFSNICFAD